MARCVSSSEDEKGQKKEEVFIPLGIGMLNIKPGSRPKSVLATNVSKDDSGTHHGLLYNDLLDRAKSVLDSRRKEPAKLPIRTERKNRKTFLNVCTIADMINRQPEHLSLYISKELSTAGSINKNGHLVLDGLHVDNKIGGALQSYVEKFVVCDECGNIDDTYIYKDKETKVYFMHCADCGSSRSLDKIIDKKACKEIVSPKMMEGL